MANIHDCLIVGGGPAGASAALQIARAGYRALVLDRGVTTGAVGRMGSLADFPGAGDKPSGEALVKRIRWQARDAGAEFREVAVSSAALAQSGRILFTKEGKKFEGRSIIIASGGSLRGQNLPGEAEFFGRGVSYSALRDGFQFRNRPVAVYGKGTAAVEAALLLSRITENVAMIVPGNKLDVDDATMELIKSRKRITLQLSASLKAITGNGQMQQAVILSGGQEKGLPIEGLFLYHQEYQTDTEFLTGTVELSPRGTVLVNQDFETSIPGVFACGDVLCGLPQLPIIAAAQGTVAALSVTKFLQQGKK